MPTKRNAPALAKREGVVCLHSRADTDAYSTADTRVQYLTRLGLSLPRAAIIAPLVFGEGSA